MENGLQDILDSLPTRRRRSKLEPYATLIRVLRARGRSYREIVTILRDRCGLRVAVHTVYHFVRARAQKPGVRRPRRQQATEQKTPRTSQVPSSSSPRSSDRPDDVRARIAAVKQCVPASPAGGSKAFAYDENTPLELIADVKPSKR